jgi:hypothetical protein
MAKFITFVLVSICQKSDCKVYVEVCSSKDTVHSKQAHLFPCTFNIGDPIK